MSVHFKSEAVINTRNSFHYKGNGYRYVLHTGTRKGTYASLQVKKSLLEDFTKSVGKVNSTGMPGLVLLQSGGGWWTVTTMNDSQEFLVSKFLARFNQWMLKFKDKSLQVQVKPIVTADNLLHKHYVLPQIQTKQPPKDTQLQALLAKFSSTRPRQQPCRTS